MAAIDRTRDLIIFKKGNTLPATVSPTMVTDEWAGGQGVQWYSTGRDEFAVTSSDGVGHAFMLWGSDESSDKYTSMTRNQPNYRFGTIGFGGWLIGVKNFEQNTLASRLALSPAPITYQENDVLYFSLRGLWTKEDEWTISSDPRGANPYTVGVVVQPPSALTNGYLTVQTFL